MKLKTLIKVSAFFSVVLTCQMSFAIDEKFAKCNDADEVRGMSDGMVNACKKYFAENPKEKSADFLQYVEARNELADSNKKNGFCGKIEEPTKEVMAPYGSRGLQQCDNLALGNMRNIYKNGSKQDFNWKKYVAYACKDKCKSNENDPEFISCIKAKNEIARGCESIAYIMNSYGRDWANEDHTKAVKGESGSAKVSGSTNGQQATTAVGSSIKCSSEGVETVDYEPCKKFQVQLDLIEGVQQVGYATQTLVYSDKMQDSQLKYSNEQNTATGALKAQGESLKMQQDMMNQRTAVEAAKLAYAYTLYTEMPRSSEVKEKCKNVPRQDQGAGQVQEADCVKAVTGGLGGFALTQNQQQIEAMRSKLITIATTTGSNMLLANLLGKRADDVDNAIAKIDAFQPADPFTTTEADAQSTYCKMNPGAAACLTGGLERTFDTMNDNVITFGEMASGTTYGSNTNDAGVTSSAIADSSTRTGSTPVGSVIAAAAQDNSMDKSTAAKVTSDGTGESGGGGGGGGGGASGGGGGGSPAAAGAGGAAAVATKAPSYSGGGGSFSVMGGFGINKKKGDGKAEDNPFGKLFGKDNAKGNGLVNFRDIASQKVGGKGDNLFDMISKRYSSVNADKRLLEYELAK